MKRYLKNSQTFGKDISEKLMDQKINQKRNAKILIV